MPSIRIQIPKSLNRPTKGSIKRRFDKLEEQNEVITHLLFRIIMLLQNLGSKENSEMAALSEIQQEIEDTKAEVAANSAVDQSAILLLRRVLALIGNAAATATDLDGLKASLETIRTAIHSDEQGLGAAVAEGTAAAPAP